MDDNTKTLPPGWVVRQSKSYPDRVYYFNIDSGLSSWEFPDILESFNSNNTGSSSTSVPVSVSVVQPTLKQTVNVENSTTSVSESQSKRTLLNPSHDHVFKGRSSTRAVSNLQKSKKPPGGPVGKYINKVRNDSESLLSSTETDRKTTRSSKQKPYTRKPSSNVPSLNVSSTKYKESVHNGCEASNTDKTYSACGSNSSKLQKTGPSSEPSNISKTGLGSQITSNSKKPPPADMSSKQRDPRAVKETSEKRDSKPGPPLSVYPKAISDTKLKSKMISGPLQSTDTTQTKAVCESVNVTKSSQVVEVVSKANAKSKYSGAVPKTSKSVSSPTKQKQKSPRVKPSSSNLVHSKPNDKANQSDVPPSQVIGKKEETVKQTQNSNPISDLRQVVRAIQKNINENRKILVKDSKIHNEKLSVKNYKKSCKSKTVPSTFSGNNDLSISTDVKLSESAVKTKTVTADTVVVNDDDDRCKNTEFKVFIGDKNKLLNIQSWINNLQEGSASNSPYLDDKVTPSYANQSTDSGYISPPTERGWPGKLQKSTLSKRDIVDMEIDECLIPAPGFDVTNIEHDSTRLDHDELEDMEVDIDTVLVQVRKELKNNVNRGLSSPIDWSDTDDGVTSADETKNTVVVVLDTNVVIHNLKLIKHLRNYTIAGNIKSTLYVPWIVLRELDGLKSDRSKPRVVMMAQTGIHYLKDLFRDKHSMVIGQTPKQADEAAVTFQSSCNDDTILQACLQCQQNYKSVVLFTNDNNLSLKSLVLKIPAYSHKGIYEGLKKAAESLCQGVSNCNNNNYVLERTNLQKVPHTPVQPPPQTCVQFVPQTCVQAISHTSSTPVSSFIPVQTQPSSSVNNNNGPVRPLPQTLPISNSHSNLSKKLLKLIPGATDQQTKKDYTEDMLMSDTLDKLKELLKECLSQVLQTEMQSVYDEVWLQVVYKKPPWSLADILISIQNHWSAVFSMVFGRDSISYIDRLIRSTARHRIYRMCDLVDVIKDCCIIMEKAKDITDYGAKVLESYNTVVIIRDLHRDIIEGQISVTSIQSLDQYINNKISSDNTTNNVINTTSSCNNTSINICNDLNTHTVINSQHTVNTSRNSSHSATCNQPSVDNFNSLFHSVPNQHSHTNSISSKQDGRSHTSTTGSQNLPKINCSQDLSGQAGTSHISNNGDVNSSDSEEMIAGDRFSTIWKFIYNHCDQFYRTILQNEPTTSSIKDLEQMLKMLVSVTLELRKYYVGFLELPVDKLTDHENEFILFSEICNDFFIKLDAPNEPSDKTVTPIHLLILYSKPEYRETLTNFHKQLDEMLNVMYHCLHKLCPDN
ncbi:RNA endoribonuclease [Mactra antiquata]